MLLNWNTIDACFLFPTFQIHSNFAFFATCLGSFLLVISLEFLRRLQRQFDQYLRSKNNFLREREFVVPKEMEERLLKREEDEVNGAGKGRAASWRKKGGMKVLCEQIARGAIHMLQFGVSYCIMLLFMYSNGKESTYPSPSSPLLSI
jgi:solute carrier family 31 (copper transporter), member 1